MILVTGGAGYVGSHFLHSYRRIHPDEEVVVVDDLSQGHPECLPKDDRTYFYQQNIGHQSEMAKVFARHPIDTVVHFAASAYVGESQVVPFKYFENNVINSLNLFKVMEAADVRKIVFSSSCATYGNPEYVPIDENHPQRPVNVYGLTKLMIEQALSALSSTLGWTFVALRYFNAAGASENSRIGESHHPETHLLPLLLLAAKGEIESVKINGTDYDTEDGTCIRDYIHVDDLADAHLAAVRYLADHERSEFVNLGTSSGSSVLEALQACRRISGKAIQVEHGPRRIGDPAALVADFQKASRLFNWRPKFDLNGIVTSAWAWHENSHY